MSKTDSLFGKLAPQPLADLLRPKTLEEIIGQGHLLNIDKPFRTMLERGETKSLIFWGPPGCGKTTLAQVIANYINMHFECVPATLGGVADLRVVFDNAKKRRSMGQGTLLFVDEIHRFNRAQQDVLLPHIENGTITLVGATTENPSFELNAALLSRMQVLTLERLSLDDLKKLLKRAESLLGKTLPLDDEGRTVICHMADGDGRYLLNMAEILFNARSHTPLTHGEISEYLQKRTPIYDKRQDAHYNLISALHKSLRGSDVNAALYWLARMLAAGEEPLYILRRLVRFASEDIGLADPQALVQTIAAKDAYEFLGSPEGELAIVQAVIYLATSPKSNAAYIAQNKSLTIAKEAGSLMPPKHILNAPTKLMKDQGYGKNYLYDHNEAEGFSGQNYFPEKLPRIEFYQPIEIGFEREIKKRLDYWQKLREKKSI